MSELSWDSNIQIMRKGPTQRFCSKLQLLSVVTIYLATTFSSQSVFCGVAFAGLTDWHTAFSKPCAVWNEAVVSFIWSFVFLCIFHCTELHFSTDNLSLRIIYWLYMQQDKKDFVYLLIRANWLNGTIKLNQWFFDIHCASGNVSMSNFFERNTCDDEKCSQRLLSDDMLSFWRTGLLTYRK